MTLAVLHRLATAPPLDPTEEAAREAARRELARPEYHDRRSWVARVLQWIIEHVQKAVDGAGSLPGGRLGVLVLAVLVLGLIALTAVRARHTLRRPSPPGLFADTAPDTAAGYRQRAEQLAAQGAWAEALRERLRAVVRALEERGLLDPRPGRTADEAAAIAGALFPDLAGRLRTAVGWFDDVWYGGRSADPQMYEAVADLDLALAAAAPTGSAGRDLPAPVAR